MNLGYGYHQKTNTFGKIIKFDLIRNKITLMNDLYPFTDCEYDIDDVIILEWLIKTNDIEILQHDILMFNDEMYEINKSIIHDVFLLNKLDSECQVIPSMQTTITADRLKQCKDEYERIGNVYPLRNMIKNGEKEKEKAIEEKLDFDEMVYIHCDTYYLVVNKKEEKRVEFKKISSDEQSEKLSFSYDSFLHMLKYGHIREVH